MSIKYLNSSGYCKKKKATWLHCGSGEGKQENELTHKLPISLFFFFFFFFKIQVRLQMRRRTLKWTLNLGSKWLNTHVIITPCSPITCLTSNCDNDLMCDSEMSKKCWFLDQINWDLLQHSSSHSKSEIQCILANTYFFVSLCSLNFNSLEPQQPRTIKKIII